MKSVKNYEIINTIGIPTDTLRKAALAAKEVLGEYYIRGGLLLCNSIDALDAQNWADYIKSVLQDYIWR